MQFIDVKIIDGELMGCPFMSDVNSCHAIEKSPINHCPTLVEADDDWLGKHTAPEDCPLRHGNVLVRLKEVVE